MKSKRRVDRERSYLAAEWLKNLPGNPRAAMYDGWLVQLKAGPGVHVVDLSGLVGNREIALLAKKDDFKGIIEACGLDYVLGFEDFVKKLTAEIIQSAEVPWAQQKRRFVLGRMK